MILRAVGDNSTAAAARKTSVVRAIECASVLFAIGSVRSTHSEIRRKGKPVKSGFLVRTVIVRGLFYRIDLTLPPVIRLNNQNNLVSEIEIFNVGSAYVPVTSRPES